MRGLPSTGLWEVVSFGISRAKNTSLEYIEDLGYPFGSSPFRRNVKFQYGSTDSGFIIVLTPTRIQSNYPQTSLISLDGLTTYNFNTRILSFGVIAVNCLGWFNWEVFETFKKKRN